VWRYTSKRGEILERLLEPRLPSTVGCGSWRPRAAEAGVYHSRAIKEWACNVNGYSAVAVADLCICFIHPLLIGC
jgi:hypothetical protein